MFDGCVAEYTIPTGHEDELEQFLKETKKLGITRNLQVFWTTCFHGVPPTSNWFDYESETWNFKWNKWTEEIPAEETALPKTLVDPPAWPIKVDKIDVLMLKELEKDPTISFVKLAKMFDLSPPAVKYRYNRLLQRDLIEGFQIFFFPFGRTATEMMFFAFDFNSQEQMAKFASSLIDKPFVNFVAKVLGRKALISQLYLTKKESKKFRDHLTKLIKQSFLRTYIYTIQDIERTKRQTFSYEFFRDGSWIYDHKKHIRDLQDLVKQFHDNTLANM